MGRGSMAPVTRPAERPQASKFQANWRLAEHTPPRQAWLSHPTPCSDTTPRTPPRIQTDPGLPCRGHPKKPLTLALSKP